MPHLNKPHPTYSPTQFHHGAIRKRAHNFRKRAQNIRQKASYSIDSIRVIRKRAHNIRKRAIHIRKKVLRIRISAKDPYVCPHLRGQHAGPAHTQ